MVSNMADVCKLAAESRAHTLHRLKFFEALVLRRAKLICAIPTSLCFGENGITGGTSLALPICSIANTGNEFAGVDSILKHFTDRIVKFDTTRRYKIWHKTLRSPPYLYNHIFAKFALFLQKTCYFCFCQLCHICVSSFGSARQLFHRGFSRG